jgi:hypothetical protein
VDYSLSNYCCKACCLYLVLLADELLDGNQGRTLPVLEGQDGLQV